MPKITPNRVATWLTAASGAAAAIAVPVANLNPTDILPGLGAVAVAFVTWMQGWQKHEARAAAPPTPLSPAVYMGSGTSGTSSTSNTITFSGTSSTLPDVDNSALEATEGDALAPTEPKLGGDE